MCRIRLSTRWQLAWRAACPSPSPRSSVVSGGDAERLVPLGAIYSHALRRRQEVLFDAGSRERTEQAIAAIRRMLEAQRLPAAPNDARCPNCSLLTACLPSVVGEAPRLRGLQGALYQVWDGDGT